MFPVQLTTSRIGNLTRLIHTLLYVMTIHTYIHTYTLRDRRGHQGETNFGRVTLKSAPRDGRRGNRGEKSGGVDAGSPTARSSTSNISIWHLLPFVCRRIQRSVVFVFLDLPVAVSSSVPSPIITPSRTVRHHTSPETHVARDPGGQSADRVCASNNI